MANLGLQSVHEPISDVTVAVSIFYTQTGPSVFITAGVKGSYFSIWHLFPHEIYCICKSRFPFTQAGHYKQEITQERAEIGDRVECFPPGWAHICRSCFLVPLLSKCPGYCKRPWVWHCRVHLRIFSCLPSTFLCPCTQRRRAPTKICTVLWAQSLVCPVPAASRRRLALKSEEAARTSPHISRNNTKAPLTLKPQPGQGQRAPGAQ